MTMKVMNVHRPMIPETFGTARDGELAPAPYLVVTLDYNGDGRRIGDIKLDFSDYAGLEAEWEAGAAVTVLEASLDDLLEPDPDPVVGDDHLTAGQQPVIGYQLNESP